MKHDAAGEDWVERVLQRSSHYIGDDGFTERLLQRLPPSRPPRHWLEAVVLGAAALLSSMLVMCWLPGSDELLRYLRSFVAVSSPLVLAGVVSVVLVGGTLLAWWIAEMEE